MPGTLVPLLTCWGAEPGAPTWSRRDTASRSSLSGNVGPAAAQPRLPKKDAVKWAPPGCCHGEGLGVPRSEGAPCSRGREAVLGVLVWDLRSVPTARPGHQGPVVWMDVFPEVKGHTAFSCCCYKRHVCCINPKPTPYSPEVAKGRLGC